MRKALTAALIAAYLRFSSSAELAASASLSIEAGSFMNITVDAPLYDPSLTTGGGCDPAGCVGGLTRDGDIKTPTSRWSCSTSLGDVGSTCTITYTLANSSTLEALHVALHKGDLRIVSVDIFVDEVMQKSWASSGTTTDFEKVELSATGKTIELRGVLDEFEWLSITEVEIMVLQDDGTTPSPTATPTTANTPAPVMATGDSYVEVQTTISPTTTAPSSTVVPFATWGPVVAPTPIEAPPTPAEQTAEPTLVDRDAGVDIVTANCVSAHINGGILAVAIAGTVGLTSLLLL